MSELKEFQIRAYGKTELAQLYLPEPGHKPRSAAKAIKRWIEGDKELHDKLYATGYHDGQKMYSPKQVRILVDYFDPPPGYIEL